MKDDISWRWFGEKVSASNDMLWDMTNNVVDTKEQEKKKKGLQQAHLN